MCCPVTSESPLQCAERVRALESESTRAHQSSRAMGEKTGCVLAESGYELGDDTYKKDAYE